MNTTSRPSTADRAFNLSTWLVDRHVEEGRGDVVAIRCGGESHTYRDVLDHVERVATGLRAIGVRSEERVAMVMLDSVEFIATFLGALRIGAIPLLTNPLLPGRDLGVIIADSRARRPGDLPRASCVARRHPCRRVRDRTRDHQRRMGRLHRIGRGRRGI